MHRSRNPPRGMRSKRRTDDEFEGFSQRGVVEMQDIKISLYIEDSHQRDQRHTYTGNTFYSEKITSVMLML